MWSDASLGRIAEREQQHVRTYDIYAHHDVALADTVADDGPSHWLALRDLAWPSSGMTNIQNGYRSLDTGS